MKKELSNVYASRSGLCMFCNGPFGKMKVNLGTVIPFHDAIRLDKSDSYFFGNLKNEKKS